VKKKIKNPNNFEQMIPELQLEINKHRSRWTLTSFASMDFQDVSQIILIHIWKKWDLYDPSQPLKPWVNRIITNQIKNLVRNNYTNYSRPCLRCDAAVGEDGCKIYKEQCEACPLFAHWKKHKQPATFVKLPLSIENHSNEVHEMKDNAPYSVAAELKLHAVMKKILKPIEFQVYQGMYIEHKEENDVAKSLGFVSNEKGRTPGYRQIRNIIKAIQEKARKYINENGIE
jgi:hypothetical protein